MGTEVRWILRAEDLDFLTFCINPAKVQCNIYPSVARACKSSILYVNSFRNSEGSNNS